MKISVRLKDGRILNYDTDELTNYDDVPEYVVKRMTEDLISTYEIAEVIAD